eukprot:gene8828-18275_t
MNNDYGTTTTNSDEKFLIELEFVQNLANPAYLHFLAQNRYFDDPAFMNYLKYLQYWKRPDFPQCLQFLDEIIDKPNFRKELAVQTFRDFVYQQQFAHWLYDAHVNETDGQEAVSEAKSAI